MFFVLTLNKYVIVEPKILGPGFKDIVRDMLVHNVEGSNLEDGLGLVVAVIRILEVGQGKLQDNTGLILVPTTYKALVMKPFKNEVIDCQVTEVNKLGFFGQVGPMRVFVSKSSMPPGWKYVENETTASYVEEGTKNSIELDMAVRVR